MSPDTFLHVSAERGESVEKGLRPLLHAKDFLLIQEHLLVPLRIVVLGEYPDEVVVLQHAPHAEPMVLSRHQGHHLGYRLPQFLHNHRAVVHHGIEHLVMQRRPISSASKF